MLTLEATEVEMDQTVLRADLQIAPQRRVAVLGPSGAGKSTLLDIIAGFRPLRSGRVLWKDEDLTASVPSARPISILFQDGNLFPHLDLTRNLALALRPDGRAPSDVEREQIRAALEQVGLDGYQDRKPGRLSGGQQGRAALARVLLQHRPVLLLDEPFAALGPALKTEMLALVQDVAAQSQALVMMVTHDPNDARNFADEVVLVADGQAAAPVPSDRFFANPPAAFRAYVGDAGEGRGA